MFRKIIFWSHLVAGLVAAIGILTMSVTGVILAYEHQIEHWADERAFAREIVVESTPLPADDLLDHAVSAVDWRALGLTIYSDPGAAAFLGGNPRERLQTYIDPYTGEDLGPGNTTVQAFMGSITRWHRWFDVSAEMRPYFGPIIDVSNVIFLFLIATGIYLWLPPVFRWTLVKSRLWFGSSPSSKARDFNWHHVFSVWALIPLVVIVFSGARISYQWPDDLVRFLFPNDSMETAAQFESEPVNQQTRQLVALTDTNPSIDYFVQQATTAYPDWKSIVLSISQDDSKEYSLTVALGEGRQPQKRFDLTFNRANGALLKTEGYGDRTTANQILGLMLPLHTGEALGFWGQTLALLASIASIFLVYTGAALSYRRLIQPLFNKRK